MDKRLSDCSVVGWGLGKDARKISLVLTKVQDRDRLINGMLRFECSEQFGRVDWKFV